MSNIKHTACPKCQANGSDKHGDNLAIYPDNSAYCFKCGYYRHASGYITNKKLDIKKQIQLPSDCTWEMPIDIQKWLYKYLDRQDIIKYRVCYSPYWNQVIFPIGLNAYNARNFNPNRPKWYFRGDKPKDYILRNPESDTLVLCEDILSGIKIHQAGYNAHILFGTSMPIEAILKPYKPFKVFRVWLDRDAQAKSLKISSRLSQFFNNVSIISTKSDPKEYSSLDIQRFVTQHKHEG